MPIDFMPIVAGAAIRACALGLIAFVGLFLFRIRSSARRHAVWTVVLTGMLLQIPLGLMIPAVLLKSHPAVPAPRLSHVMESARLAAPSIQGFVPKSHGLTEHNWATLSGTLTAVYLAVSILLLLRFAHGYRGLRQVLRAAAPIPRLGPLVFESALFAVPGSAGWLRARIVLPIAWRDWDAVKLHCVLAHERAHIDRWDWLIRLASQVNVCVFWFHPLAWWLERALSELAEEVCDDVAVCELEDSYEYAATLVEIAQAAIEHGGVLKWGAISMASDSNVVRRVNRILAQTMPRPKPLGRLGWLILLGSSLPVIYLSAAVELAQVSPIVLPAARAPMYALPAQAATGSTQNTPRPVTRSRREDTTVTICLVIDNSGSMRGKREAVRAAALALVKASKPDDDVCIIDFNDEVFNGLPKGEDFTGDAAEMEEALTRIDSRGGKAMRDAVSLSMEVAQTGRHDRRALVLITEGNDSASRITQEQLLSSVKGSGVRIYCIGLVGEDEPRRAGSARVALREIAEASGGMDYYPASLEEVERIAPEVGKEIRKF
jgi:beta-lactamase regulating signal transducer with metallopeptidase domain/Mg-chelatase subunit ChlD